MSLISFSSDSRKTMIDMYKYLNVCQKYQLSSLKHHFVAQVIQVLRLYHDFAYEIVLKFMGELYSQPFEEF